jgi:hypothetical protein
MDKSNFKKMALMGMAGGMLLASQAPATVEAGEEISGTYLASNGCHGGCSAQSGRRMQQGGCSAMGGQRSSGCSARQSGCSSSSRQSGCSARQNRYTADADQDASMQQSQGRRIMTESDLQNQLSSDTKAQFRQLSPEAKATALRLAVQSGDADSAVRQAAMQDQSQARNGQTNRNFNYSQDPNSSYDTSSSPSTSRW